MKKIFAIVTSFLLPVLAFAQNTPPVFTTSPDATTILGRVQTIANYVIPFLVTLGVIYFIYGVITYVISKGEEAKKEGRDRMIYGIIGLFVIVSLWGIVGILGNTFQVSQQGGALNPSQIPSVYVQ